jgi:signal transduction histidine kinase
MVKTILGATISVSSTAGQGACFELSLPRVVHEQGE